MTPGARTSGGADEAAVEAALHLQKAAVELIAAARAALDATERVVRDPAVAAHVLHLLGEIVRAPAPPPPASPAPRRNPAGPKVTRIRIG